MTPDLNAIPLIFSSRPVYYLLHVTGKCNAQCSHCFYWEDIRDGKTEEDLKFGDYQKLSHSMGDVLVINLCGAEAFIRKDLPDLAHLFSTVNHCKLMTIPSNGFLTEKIVEDVKRMCRENPDTFFRFAFSLDGPPEQHDKIRDVPGLFEKCCETIRQIASLKEKFSNFVLLTTTVFSADTQDHILDFLDWLRVNLPVEQNNVTFVRGNPMNPETLKVDANRYQAVLAKIKANAALEAQDKKLASILPYSMFLNTMDTIQKANQNPGKRVFKCFGGHKFVVVSRKGDVFPCELLDEGSRMGNLRDFDWDIGRLLRSQQAQSVVKWVSEEHCACTWECAIQSSKLFDPKQWPALTGRAVKVAIS